LPLPSPGKALRPGRQRGVRCLRYGRLVGSGMTVWAWLSVGAGAWFSASLVVGIFVGRVFGLCGPDTPSFLRFVVPALPLRATDPFA
jgi:hypothetical protein